MERYPILKEEVGGSNTGYEISSLPNGNFLGGQLSLCFGIGMLAFCLKKK